MQAEIAKWGNSLALRLPRTIAADAHLHEGTTVDLKVEGQALVVRSARPKYKLRDLLRQFKPEHRHEEVEWGEAKGDEVW